MLRASSSDAQLHVASTYNPGLIPQTKPWIPTQWWIWVSVKHIKLYVQLTHTFSWF